MNRKYSPHRLAIFLMFSIAVLMGCKKEKDDTSPPAIVFSSPNAGQSFLFNGQIAVNAEVTDDQKIVDITIDVVNQLNQTFLQSIHYRPQNKSYTIQTNLYHTDRFLDSGTYYVRVKASDGEHESTSYQEIYLTGAPTVLEKTMVVRSDIFSTQIDSLNNNSLTNWMYLDGAYAYGGIESRLNLFTYGRKNQSLFLTYSFEDLTLINNTFLPTGGGGEYSCFSRDDQAHEFFYGFEDGSIWKFSSNGYTYFAQPFDNLKVVHIVATENYIYAIKENAMQTIRQLQVYYRSTGAEYQSLDIPFDVKGMAVFDNENKLLVVGNEGSNSIFRFYNNETNALNGVFNFYDTSPVSGMWKGNGGNYYVSHQSGIAYYTNYLDSYSINTTLQPSKLVIEKLSGAVYAITDEGIHILNEDCSNEVSFAAATEVVDIWFKYNK